MLASCELPSSVIPHADGYRMNGAKARQLPTSPLFEQRPAHSYVFPISNSVASLERTEQVLQFAPADVAHVRFQRLFTAILGGSVLAHHETRSVEELPEESAVFYRY